MPAETRNAGATGLNKTIGLYGAVSLALGIVIGAGMLSLPGLVYQQSGGWAVYAWLFNGVLVLPLLFVFAVLGRRFPNAGGVAGFIGQAFPRLRPGSAYLLVGTFSLGLPGIALTGAEYAAGGFASATDREPEHWLAAGIAAILLGLVIGAAWLGARVAGGIQNVVVAVLVLSLAAVALACVPGWADVDFSVGNPTWVGVWSGMGLAFFAYTGWEMLSFMTEEFKNPRRDFPLAVSISFAVVMALYLGTALAVQAYVEYGDRTLEAAPFLIILKRVLLDGPGTGVAVAVLVVVIVVANLNGAVWAASRLIFDIARSGWAPRGLALHRVAGPGNTPRAAIAALSVLFALVLCLHGGGLLTLSDLLRVAGQNFFLLYVLAIAAFIKVERHPGARLFGIAAFAICVAFAGVFGWALLCAAALFGLPYLVDAWMNRNRKSDLEPQIPADFKEPGQPADER